MKIKKINTFLCIIITFVLLFNLSFNLIANAATSDLLISLGTGEYEITVTTSTTVDDIIEVLGEPKLATVSAFGGEAYTFYTDDEYSNYLYIETLNDGEIISYGSIDKTYKTQTYSYGDDYPYKENNSLAGVFVSNNGIVAGGVYYNKEVIGNDTLKIKELFEQNYLSNPTLYLKGISQHGVIMYNALSQKLGNKYQTPLVFNEEYFYINEQFKEFGSSIREYMLETDNNIAYMKSAGVKSNLELTKPTFILNPLVFADLAGDNKYTNFEGKDNAVFDYDVDRKILYAAGFSDDAFEQIDRVPYTEEEQEKLNKGREEYKKAVQKLDTEDIYETEPVSTVASGLVAGELKDSVKEGVVDYVNAIRVAAGVPKVELDEESFNVAQHKATLLSYRYSELGLGIAHSVDKPDGVSDEFFNTAMGNGKGYAENLSQGLSSQTGKRNNV